jgi:hypothetical protein
MERSVQAGRQSANGNQWQRLNSNKHLINITKQLQTKQMNIPARNKENMKYKKYAS